LTAGSVIDRVGPGTRNVRCFAAGISDFAGTASRCQEPVNRESRATADHE